MNYFVGATWADRFGATYDHFFSTRQPVSDIVPFLVDKLTPAARILEVGVGSGRVAGPLADRAPGEVWGLDISTRMLDILRQRFAHVRPLQLDITLSAPDSGPFDSIYCICNTLFMLGAQRKQDAALKHLRECATNGGRLLLEHFQPIHDDYGRDSLALDPVHMTADEVLLRVEKVDAAARVIEGQDIYLAHGEVSMAPFSFNYRTVGEVDEAARAVGWQMSERYASWAGAEFREASPNVISIYKAR